MQKPMQQPKYGRLIQANAWLVIFLVLSTLPLGYQPVPPSPAPVSPAVIEDAAGGEADFLVVLKETPDLSRLNLGGKTPAEKRQAVFEALIETSQRSQAGLIARLEAGKIPYHAYWLANLVAVRGSLDLVNELSHRPEVAEIASNRSFKNNLPQPETVLAPQLQAPQAVEWNITRIGAPAVWAQGYHGEGIVYASADTGVMWDHPALKDQYRGWDGAVADHNYNWFDPVEADLSGDLAFVDCDLVPCDDDSVSTRGHGTHVMGIGVGLDSFGHQIGVAPQARWIGCRNMEAGWGNPASYIACLQFFLAPTDLAGNNPDPAQGADVVGNSYGCTLEEGCPSSALEMAVNNMRIAGIFMSVSAGNDGPGCSSVIDPPGNYDSSISVGATDLNDIIAGFSSRGPVGSLLKPDLVAPGMNILSSSKTGSNINLSGTSMAAPHVAGAVALLWSARPELRGDVERTEDILRFSAVHLTTTETCGGTQNAIPNNVYGYGRVDVAAALQLHLVEQYFPLVGR